MKPSGDPAAYELTYREAVRAIETQNASLEGLRTRAGIVLSGAALVAGFVGAIAGSQASASLAAAASILLVLAAVLSTYLLLPIDDWRASVDAHRLLADYVETDPPASIAEIHRSLAYWMQCDWLVNEATLRSRNRILAVAAGAVVAETVAWLLAARL